MSRDIATRQPLPGVNRRRRRAPFGIGEAGPRPEGHSPLTDTGRLATLRSGDGRLAAVGVQLCFGQAQDLSDRQPETISEPPNDPQADVPFATLGVADVVTAQSGELTKRLLRETSLHAQRAQRDAKSSMSGTERGHPRTF